MAQSDRRVALGAVAAGLFLLACAGDPAPKPMGGASQPVASALPQLPQLSGELRDVVAPHVDRADVGDSVRLTIAVEPGARVNALLPPVIEASDGRRFTLRAPTVTEDSAYFVEPASVTVARAELPIRGTLRTSFCRSDERLCRSAERPVVIEER